MSDLTIIDDKIVDQTDTRSVLPMEAKKTLVTLLRYGVMLAKQKSLLFQTLVQHQVAIKTQLANMYLKLILDEKQGVAFIESLDGSDPSLEENDEPMSLIYRRTLSLYDTLLLLVLRKHYQERETVGEKCIVIDVDRVESYLCPFVPLTNNSKVDRQKLSGALQKFVEKRILSAVRGSEDRFEITPIIRYVVNATFLEKMLQTYHDLAEKQNIDVSQTRVEDPKHG